MENSYTPDAKRYTNPPGWFRRCGRSGLMLPAISLGCWHNFGAAPAGWTEANWHENARKMLFGALDLGITHFDLANNYGPPPGSAEERAGRILREMPRDELVISTKAGYLMWPGPYGEWGSRKYLLASLDQSLRRLGLDYVDIFYHHRPDPNTPLEESLGALEHAVRSGKAVYAGISSYSAGLTRQAVHVCKENRFPQLLIHQPNYNMFSRWIEAELLATCGELGLGIIAFCPLAQGLLTNRYLQGIPADSRAGSRTGFLKPQHVTEDALAKVRQLNQLAQARGQSLAQMSLAWVLRHSAVTTALIGASKLEQIQENVAALNQAGFTADELQKIENILSGQPAVVKA